ncbi:hypothetical protein BDZ89DRAFT_416348 [Hymenopellis radicata]|nr:hypothetical protein BDZ89DRAFT_416348 [Hymenopellis radicata]
MLLHTHPHSDLSEDPRGHTTRQSPTDSTTPSPHWTPHPAYSLIHPAPRGPCPSLAPLTVPHEHNPFHLAELPNLQDLEGRCLQPRQLIDLSSRRKVANWNALFKFCAAVPGSRHPATTNPPTRVALFRVFRLYHQRTRSGRIHTPVASKKDD